MKWWMLLGGAAAAGGVAYLAHRGMASSNSSSKGSTKVKGRIKGIRLRPTGAGGTLPDVPGLREREAAEPGFAKALLQVIKETGADGDKLAAYMSARSGFRPDYIDSKPSGPSNWHGGVGLIGFSGGRDGSGLGDAYAGELSAYKGFQPSPAEYVRQMTAIDQVNGPLKHWLMANPLMAKDPALHILAPFIRKPGNTEELPGSPPTWTAADLAAAPDSFTIIEQPFVNMNPLAHATPWDEMTWPELGNFDSNKDGTVTLGDIRNRYYGRLNGAPRFQP